MTKSPFEYKSTEEPYTHNRIDRYKASFELPDDGTPDSGQRLIVTVYINEDGEQSIDLSVSSSAGAQIWELGSFYTTKSEPLARLLYGAARMVTTKSFKPV